MIPFTLFPSVAVGDRLLVSVDPALAVLVALAGTAMVVWAIWLSHRPQPVPSEAAWRLNEGARRGPYKAKRRRS